MKKTLIVTALLALILPGCSAVKNAKEFMAQMGAVEDAVVKLTKHDDVQIVHFNGHILQVILVNSEYNDMEGEKKEKASRKIAETAAKALKNPGSIDEVMVVFHIHDTKLGVVEYNNSLDSHKFKLSELQSGPSPSPSP